MPATIPLVAVLAGGFASAAVGGGIINAVLAAGVTAGQVVLIGNHQNDLRAAEGPSVPNIFAACGYGTRSGEDAQASSRGDLPALVV